MPKAKAAAKSRSRSKKPALKPSVRRRLPNTWRLTRRSATIVWQHKKLLAGIALVYGLLSLVFTAGVGAGDVSGIKSNLQQSFNGHVSHLGMAVGGLVGAWSSGGSTVNDSASTYQFFLLVIGSLAIIWALRQLLAGARVRIRDAYYQGPHPLVPFILVLLIVGLQLLPLAVGTSLYSLVVSNGIAVNGFEQALWGLLAIALTALTLYWICSSIFALYVVTLPDMTPLKALRSARGLVCGRRLSVLRKLLWLPLVLVIIAVIVMLPVILWLTPLARWIFLILTAFALVAVHTYMYTLYRELLNE